MPSFRGGGPGHDIGVQELPMTPPAKQYEPNTVHWTGKGTTFPPMPPGATNEMPQIPSSATLGNPILANPIVTTFPPARGRG